MPDAERTAVVREHGAGAGELLWQVLGLLRAWLATGYDAHGSVELIPAPDAEARYRYLRSVAPWLGFLDHLVRQPDSTEPARDRIEEIASAASYVAQWAEETGSYRTAIGYAQVAAAALPDEPWPVYHAGRLARKAGEPEQAVTWFRRAGRTAREYDDTDTLVLVLQGLGHVHRSAGRLLRARSWYRHAFECASRHDRVTLAGDALGDLCMVELERGDLRAALPLWDRALALLETGSLRLFRTAQDAAHTLMDLYGAFESPFLVFDALLEHVWQPRRRLLLHGQRARAAAGARLYHEFETSWSEALVLLDVPGSRGGGSAALVQLAQGATLLRHRSRARYALSRAADIAEEEQDEATAAYVAGLAAVLAGDAPLDELWSLAAPKRFASDEADIEHLCTSGMIRFRSRDRGDPYHPR